MSPRARSRHRRRLGFLARSRHRERLWQRDKHAEAAWLLRARAIFRRDHALVCAHHDCCPTCAWVFPEEPVSFITRYRRFLPIRIF